MPVLSQFFLFTRVMRLARAVFILGFVTQALCAQSEFTGRILDKVICEEDSTQSYALYVPSNYTNTRKWPVIFCFDASARGRMPVERLRLAAEKYGYLIAGSLTSRNGPWEANSVAAQAMVKDVSSHFSVDAGRIYTTGVSGGARVATALALSGLAKGVIACSAGFPIPDKIPTQLPFVFFGTAGVEDFNYWEMQRLDEKLSNRKAVHRTVTFKGGHEWASAELMREAVEWLELQAMKTGILAKNDDFVGSQFQARLVMLPEQGGVDRWRALQSLVADFSGLVDTSSIEQEEKELRVSSEVKGGLKKEEASELSESKLLEKLGESAMESTSRKQTFSTELRRKAESSPDLVERLGIRRVLAAYFFMTRESVRRLFDEHDYGGAASVLEFSSMLRPGEKQIFFDLARARALNGDKKRAIASLRAAFTTGLRDVERIQSEPAFAKLAGDIEFQRFLLEIRNPPRESILEMPVMRVSAALASVELRVFSQPNVESATRPLAFLRVEKIRQETTAARAGIVPGMEIMAIQGIRVRGLSEEELNDIMQQTIKTEIILIVREPPRRGEWEIRIPLRKPSIETTPPTNEREIDSALATQ
jgi:dienelactone hydrolase